MYSTCSLCQEDIEFNTPYPLLSQLMWKNSFKYQKREKNGLRENKT